MRALLTRRLKMFKKIILVLFLFLVFPAWGASLENFKIFPDYLFTDEDLGVKFSAKLESVGVKPKALTLMEVNEEKGFIKYRWPLNDEGMQGDEKAQDGVYGREIQFKEKNPTQLVFYVLLEEEELRGPASQSVSLPKVPPSQRAILEIRAHPTFIDILKDVWKKIKQKFHFS